MPGDKKHVILFDLPTFPKGVISLSLLSVSACLSPHFHVKIVDFNFSPYNDYMPRETAAMFGLKVSSQNFEQAISLSRKLKKAFPTSKVVWGGELPTLMPDLCLAHADVVFGGLFEPIAPKFIDDLKSGNLQPKYFGKNTANHAHTNINFTQLPHPEKYYSFMGYPLETSRGCSENCIFCMVHTMQKKNYNLISWDALRECIKQYDGKFINIIDYNFGVDASHVKQVSQIIKGSGALGWMAEMCIELLDNDEVLAALRDSRCKIIYCGLESIDEQSLKSVNKMRTNHVENYERIIRKAQSYGIQIAAGIIVGIEGTHENTFKDLYSFYQRMGIIYAKLTFLIYNPGTRVQAFVKKKGTFVTENINHYDGNQLSYLPDGVNYSHVKKGAMGFIKKYYSLTGIVLRSYNTKLNTWARLEYILFNLFYRKVYFDWLRYDIFDHPERVRFLVEKPLVKTKSTIFMEKTLAFVRRKQLNRKTLT